MSSIQKPDVWHGTYDATTVTVILCSGISLYNALELIPLIFITFSRWRGLYFWSLLISCFAILLYNIGFMIQYFELTYDALGRAIDGLGWIGMVTGQAFVLYSRLGLILRSDSILRAVKWMIITNAILLHPVTEVMNFGANFGPAQQPFARGYIYVEKIQMTVFCIQEFILSGLYVWQTVQHLRVVSKERVRRMMWELFTVNLIIVVLDIALLTIEYLDYRTLEQTVKGFVYSVKLKMEFAILGKLVDLVQSTQRSLSTPLGMVETYGDATMNNEHVQGEVAGKSRPAWLVELDKPSVEHVEHAAHTYQTQMDVPHIPDGDMIEIAHDAQRPRRHRRDQSDTDFLYAEAMRSVST